MNYKESLSLSSLLAHTPVRAAATSSPLSRPRFQSGANNAAFLGASELKGLGSAD